MEIELWVMETWNPNTPLIAVNFQGFCVCECTYATWLSKHYRNKDQNISENRFSQFILMKVNYSLNQLHKVSFEAISNNMMENYNNRKNQWMLLNEVWMILIIIGTIIIVDSDTK